MDACSAPGVASGFIGSVTGFVDCQAQVLGTGAWAALAAPGSTLAMVLAAFLTIFIALVGYNLLLGTSLTVREATLAFVKIGAVFALATSWPAYRTLVYDVVTDGPGQLVNEIGPRSGVTGADGTLVERLDLADRALVQLSILGAGNPRPGEQVEVPPPPFGGFDAFALGGSRIIFLLGATAALSLVRIIAGLMLALGPFFIAFLLFEQTRSLFEGWVRVLAGAALGTVAVSITLGLELGLMEPWLGSVLARRMADEPLPAMPTELFVIACLFALALISSLYASMRVTSAFRLAPAVRVAFAGSGSQDVREGTATRAHVETRTGTTYVEQGRAHAAAAILSAVSRRDGAPDGGASLAGHRIQPQVGRGRDVEVARQPVPLGRSFSRRSSARVSALATRRDGGR